MQLVTRHTTSIGGKNGFFVINTHSSTGRVRLVGILRKSVVDDILRHLLQQLLLLLLVMLLLFLLSLLPSLLLLLLLLYDSVGALSRVHVFLSIGV